MIPYGRQEISEADIEAVVNVLRSDWLTQGPAVECFEREVARYCGAQFAVAVSNATAALHIACLAAELGPGDFSWTSPNTFVASANCALYCGARVDFVDIDARTYNLDADLLEQKLASAAQQGTLPKVVIPVHFAGQSCDMVRIGALGKQYGITIIEDASHAVGARNGECLVGACDFSDMTVFSFHPVKIITTGEGGMVLTNRRDLYEKLLRLRSHGITRAPELMAGKPDGAWSYQQIELGFNYRLTDIQAALGSSQLQRLDEFVCRRHEIAHRYDAGLRDLPLYLPLQQAGSYSAYHLYVIQIDDQKTSKTRRQAFDQLRAAGIQVNVHYIPVHTQPHYLKLGFQKGDFPTAERYYANTISLPIYSTLSEVDQDFVIATLRGMF